MRRRLAQVLRAAATRLHPAQVTVTGDDTAGWTVTIHGTPLAHIGPGQITDRRPPLQLRRGDLGPRDLADLAQLATEGKLR